MEGSTNELKQLLSQPPPNYIPPPNGFGGHHQQQQPNPITILHASLEHIRNTGDTQYLFVRCLLEVLCSHEYLASSNNDNNNETTQTNSNNTTPLSSDEEQLLFHCITGLRHVTLYKWDEYNGTYKEILRDLMLSIGLLVPGTTTKLLPRTVSMACLATSASFWKRSWSTLGTTNNSGGSNNNDNHENLTTQNKNNTDDQQQLYLTSLISSLHPSMQRFQGGGPSGGGGGDIISIQQELFGYLNTLLVLPFNHQSTTTNNSTQQLQSQQIMVAATQTSSFLSLLLGEFSGGNSSARYNLPLEFHRLSHHLYESGSDDYSISVNHKKSGLDLSLGIAMGGLSSLVGYIGNNSSSSSNNGAVTVVVDNETLLDLGSSIVDLTCEVLSWEFGAGACKWDFASGNSSRGSNNNGSVVLLRPPQRWREVLINPEFLGAIINVYLVIRVGSNNNLDATIDRNLLSKRGRMAHLLRQLLLHLSSIAGGPIFSDDSERGAYAGFILDGTLNVLELILGEQQQQQNQNQQEHNPNMLVEELQSDEIVDLVTILSRLTTNFRIKILSSLKTFPRYLVALCTMGKWLLESNLNECRRVEGDVESMEGVDWRNDAISQILACSDAMADDYWLVSGTGGKDAVVTSRALSTMLAPLYGPYCTCRVQMSCLEEHYMSREEADLDEIREEISAFGLEEEMSSAASLGRLNVLSSMTTLASMFQQCVPRLLALFDGAGSGGEITPDMTALLEEARMLLLCACHLLTDDCVGETPAIPESVIFACQSGGVDSDACTASITSLIEMLKSIAEAQAMKAAAYPADPRLSPLLAKTLLWFFRRWAPAYILPTSEEYRENQGGILSAYSKSDTVKPTVSFCTTLCLLYFCHWPQEKEVQHESTTLLLALAKKGAFVRSLMVSSPSFEKTAALHSICAGLRHNASQEEISTVMTAIGNNGDLSIDVVRGYQRLPYDDRARVLTCLVVACSDMQDVKSNAVLAGCLKAVEVPFSTLVQALATKQVNAKDINVQESACLSILLYGGIVLASEMSEPERIPHFITNTLPHLSGLMTYYAEDLTICEGLLKLFRDYAEQYIAMLTREQCIDLFTSSSSLLKHYSEHHCKNRIVLKRSEAIEEEFEEEQKYNDVMCAIQLLIHLGTKDFTYLCNTETTSKGVDTNQITDVIFFGLQQILPLMTQGLLQYPTLCQHYFSLVGFMVETYPEKLCALPFELFNSLLESLLFGMSHSDPLVSKSSLQGLASLAREHLKTGVLATHLSTKGDIFDNCTARLIQEVVFQPIIWDRLEPAGSALLPLAAVDVPKFIGLVNSISQQLGSDDKQRRLHAAFEKLIKPDMLAKVAAEGREGRIVRVQFKSDFNEFVRNVQSFLIMK